MGGWFLGADESKIEPSREHPRDLSEVDDSFLVRLRAHEQYTQFRATQDALASRLNLVSSGTEVGHVNAQGQHDNLVLVAGAVKRLAGEVRKSHDHVSARVFALLAFDHPCTRSVSGNTRAPHLRFEQFRL